MSANDSKESQETSLLTVEIRFPYFKQGDDFEVCNCNLYEFAKLHNYIAEYSLQIYNMIPIEARPYVKGEGKTHVCTLTGPTSVMKKLIDAGLVDEIPNYEDSEENSDEDINSDNDEDEE